MHQVSYRELPADQVKSLFADDPPVPVRLWAILDQGIASSILVDDRQQPTLAFVQELAEHTVYIGGQPTAQSLAEGIDVLRRETEVVVCDWQGGKLAELLPEDPDYQGMAIDFTDRSEQVDLREFAQAPAGLELRRIRRDDIPLLQGYDYYLRMYGAEELAVARTIGYCLIHEGTVISEAVAGPFAHGVAEIGVGTRVEFQRRGLGTLTAARAIQACESLGYQAFWNSAAQNSASIALARRLGFQKEDPFLVFVWSKRG